jgi:hypothetical protein
VKSFITKYPPTLITTIKIFAGVIDIELPLTECLQFPLESQTTDEEWQAAPGALQSIEPKLGKPLFWLLHCAKVKVITLNKTITLTSLCILNLLFFFSHLNSLSKTTQDFFKTKLV